MNIDGIRDLYRKRAGNYDFTAQLYYLVGYRLLKYRKMAIKGLNLKRGDRIVDIGCGTGLNFPLLVDRAGPDGRIVGVDLTEEMLKKARDRVRKHHWSNVKLVQSDAGKFTFPDRVDGVISTAAISLMPGYDEIIRRGAEALSPGGRFVILDFKLAENRPQWLTNLLVMITKPFGITLDIADRKPYESVGNYLNMITFFEHYLGYAYIAIGEKDKRQGVRHCLSPIL